MSEELAPLPEQVVLYVDNSGKEAITEPEPAEEANERAKQMARDGIQVLSVVDPAYGNTRVGLDRSTRVWYREQGEEADRKDLFSNLMTYREATMAAVELRERGYEILGLISQEQFLERVRPDEDDEVEGAPEPSEPLRRAVERMEKLITRSTESRAMVADHHAESRRYQAVELALRLMEQKKGSLSPREMASSAMATQVIQDAKIIEKYLKGTAPRRPKTP